MLINFLYAVWFLIPTLLFLIFLSHQFKENKNKNQINHSKLYKQTTIFTLIVAFLSVTTNLLIIENISFTSEKYPHLKEMAQILLYPIILFLSVPFSKGVEPPTTLQDKIKQHGHIKGKEEYEKSNKKSGSR